jgi:DNA-binding response OmpR family regulator
MPQPLLRRAAAPPVEAGPARADAKDVPLGVEHPGVQQAAPDRPLVLVADDEEDIRMLLAYRMQKAGYDVIEAADGEEAVRLAAERAPALAILDVMMPKVDGYEATRRLRGLDATSRMPIILLTARVQEADVQRGFDAGADDYIKKPFSPQELRARVQAILGRR